MIQCAVRKSRSGTALRGKSTSVIGRSLARSRPGRTSIHCGVLGFAVAGAELFGQLLRLGHLIGGEGAMEIEIGQLMPTDLIMFFRT